ncbi:MAG: GGDEF domain-containing protein [Desulfobulbaceae bacterium]|nr:GGDEF domain-containing protein [Desulfobulbaceae bacterium]HIJ79288.1 GGDEF domain-containing protein [Deltaproteobacteria bacterium]
MAKTDIQNLEDIVKHIDRLLDGDKPGLLAAASATARDAQPMIDSLNKLTLELSDLDQSLLNLSCGDINTAIHAKIAAAHNLKKLQSHLEHLMWQIAQVAQGDYGQTIDFNAILSENFNKIIDQLQKNQSLTSCESSVSDCSLIWDPLTGVRNRVYLVDFGKIEFARAQRYANDFSIILLDVDFLKKINKTYGYKVGDEVLRTLGAGLTKALREIDVLGRLGGEEFAVFLPATGLDAAELVAGRLRELVEMFKVFVDTRVVHFTVSMGVSTVRKDDKGFEAVMERAGAALFLAKNGGRNRVVVEG